MIVHGIGAKLVSNWEQNMLHTTRWQPFCTKRISMLKGLKMSSLGFKCVFYRLEHNAKWGPHATEF